MRQAAVEMINLAFVKNKKEKGKFMTKTLLFFTLWLVFSQKKRDASKFIFVTNSKVKLLDLLINC